MTRDERIAKALTFLYRASPEAVFVGYYLSIEVEDAEYDNEYASQICDFLESYGLAKSLETKHRMVIQRDGIAVEEAGGYLAYLQKLKDEEAAREKRDALEITLAESNIEANKLNQKNANRNMFATIVNIIIGLLNLAVLAMQLS